MTCEKITYLIDKGYLTRLNIAEKLQVKLHSYYCNCCKNYPKDSVVVDRMLAKLDQEDDKAVYTDLEKKQLKELLEQIANQP